MTDKIRDFKLLIGIPSRGDFKSDFALNLVFMIHLMTANPIVRVAGELRRVLWNVNVTKTSNLSASRQKIVDMAIAAEVDSLLFLDDDMVFDPNFLGEWLEADRPVIAMNCPTRSIPCHATARARSLTEPFKGSVIYSDTATARWEEVWRVGTGIFMLRRDALLALPRPAFTPRWVPENDDYAGEDWVMVEHLEAAGIPVVVDHKFSVGIGHVGDLMYTMEMAAGTRMAVARQKQAKSGIVIP